MLPLKLENPGRPLAVLCIGAHCDDIEIGCGGTLARLAEEYPGTRFSWVVLAGEPLRAQECRAAAAHLLSENSGVSSSVRFFDFPDRYFPSRADAIKDAFEAIKDIRPDVVFTHHLSDRHQDHRVVAELTWNAFRSHLILEYEIPKYEGDLGHPNVYLPLDTRYVDRKVRCLMDCYASQRSRAWFTEDTFRALARLRGLECNAPSGFAEAFHGRKLCL